MLTTSRRTQLIDLTGQVFGRWRVIGRAENVKTKQQAWWHCICECGTEKAVRGELLRKGLSKSCGCYKRAQAGNAQATHRLSRTPLYKRRKNMMQRCYNSKCREFKYYGSRGITVCERWRVGENGEHPFILFLRDMGPRPSPKHSIERIDNSRGYEPSNCCWATRVQQARNKRNNVFVEYKGQHVPLTDALVYSGVPYGTLSSEKWRQKITHQRAFDAILERRAAKTARAIVQVEINPVMVMES
jgi:hypothetical protein